jgi:hydroxymethylbilane synthase
MASIRIGSRGSRLALVQARAVIDALRRERPEVSTEIEIIHTAGDRETDLPLDRIGGTGVFIKEIEQALLEGRIDLAVHSMKDVPTTLPDGLVLAATTERADARDVLVAKAASSLDTLPPGATVATGSLRRRSQLLASRPDLRIEDLRGNVGTRLSKLDRSSWDAIVLAAAGLLRLNLETRIAAYLPVESMLPAVGQGALALETRADDGKIREQVEVLDHEPTARAVRSERAFLARLGGGCQVPIAAHADLRGGSLLLRGYVGSVGGARHLRAERSSDPAAAESLGVELAEFFLDRGAAEILGSREHAT